MSTRVNDVARALDQVVEDVGGTAIPVTIAARAVDIMRPLIPVRTGALRASATGDVHDGRAVVTVGGGRIDYAAAVDKRVDFTGRATPEIETLAQALYKEGIDDITRRNNLT